MAEVLKSAVENKINFGLLNNETKTVLYEEKDIRYSDIEIQVESGERKETFTFWTILHYSARNYRRIQFLLSACQGMPGNAIW